MTISFTQFAAAAVVSYLGLLAGFFLASLTKEELPTARRYFPWLQRLVILAIAAVAFDFFGFSLALKAVSYALALLIILILKINLTMLYAAFGVALFAVSSSGNTLMVISSLVFILGIISGSDYFAKEVRKLKKVKTETAAAKDLLVKNSAYVAVALTLFVLFAQIGLVRLVLQLK